MGSVLKGIGWKQGLQTTELQVGAGSLRLAHPRSKDHKESPCRGSQNLPAPAFYYASRIFKLNRLDVTKVDHRFQTAEFSHSWWWIFFAALAAFSVH